MPAGVRLTLAPGCRVTARRAANGEPLLRRAFGRTEPVGPEGLAHLVVFGALAARGAELSGEAFGGVLVLGRGRARLSSCRLRSAGLYGVLALELSRAGLSRCRVEAREPLTAAGFARVRAADCATDAGARAADDAALFLRRCTGRAAVEGAAILRESQAGRAAAGAEAPSPRTLGPWALAPSAPSPGLDAREPKAAGEGASAPSAHLQQELCVMTTASMSPLLEPGDFMLVAPLDGNERPGDLLLLPVSPMNPAKRVHRLVALEGGTAITRGDANPTPDLERLALSAALGRVVAVGKGGAWRRVDGPGARLKGRIVAAGFRALDAAAARVGETPRLDSALGRAAGRLRRSDLPWRLAAALGRGARRRWTELWLACEERERKPGTSWDWLRAAWARWAARV